MTVLPKETYIQYCQKRLLDRKKRPVFTLEIFWVMIGRFWVKWGSQIHYGVTIMSTLLKIIGLFCKRALWKRRYSAKETYNFKEPANRSHPIATKLSWTSALYGEYRSLLSVKKSLLSYHRSLLSEDRQPDPPATKLSWICAL